MKFKVGGEESENVTELRLNGPDVDGDVFLDFKDSDGSWVSILWINTEGQLVLNACAFERLKSAGFDVTRGRKIKVQNICSGDIE